MWWIISSAIGHTCMSCHVQVSPNFWPHPHKSQALSMQPLTHTTHSHTHTHTHTYLQRHPFLQWKKNKEPETYDKFNKLHSLQLRIQYYYTRTVKWSVSTFNCCFLRDKKCIENSPQNIHQQIHIILYNNVSLFMYCYTITQILKCVCDNEGSLSWQLQLVRNLSCQHFN